MFQFNSFGVIKPAKYVQLIVLNDVAAEKKVQIHHQILRQKMACMFLVTVVSGLIATDERSVLPPSSKSSQSRGGYSSTRKMQAAKFGRNFLRSFS